MAFADGTTLGRRTVHEELASKLRAIPYPFASSSRPSVEIYHGNHRAWRRAPLSTLRALHAQRRAAHHAGYTCTHS